MISETTNNLYNILKRNLLMIIILVMFFSTIGFGFITYISVNSDRNFINNRINNVLSRVIEPSLEISDTIETKRLLNLASGKNHFIAIINKDYDILVSDYKNINNVQKIIEKEPSISCNDIRIGSLKGINNSFNVSCHPLYSTNGTKTFLGLMLNFSNQDNLPFAENIILYSAALFLFSIILIFFIIKKVINNHLIEPVSALQQDILEKIKNPLNIEYKDINTINASIEIKTIRKSFYQLLDKLNRESARNLEIEKSAVLYQLSRQLAHDIRSPLAALEMMMHDISQFPEEKRIITRNAISRIRDIANNLLNQHPENNNSNEAILPCLLTSVIDSLISEKRIQYQENININIDFFPSTESYGLFASIKVQEFKCILSNLINNAVEAICFQGDVLTSLEKIGDYALIKIKDNGPGIPKIVLNNLGKPGNTFNKPGGSGLGISSAMASLEEWNGSLEFTSTQTDGTVANIKLPLASPPSWFLTNLIIQSNSQILIIDDDTSIHQIWKDRFTQLNLHNENISWFNFFNTSALSEWLVNNYNYSNPLIILCDYEIIGSQENGLKILEQFGNVKVTRILVTSRYNQPEIQQNCETLGIYLLPKSLASLIPINLFNTKPLAKSNILNPDLVLIDDDQTLVAAWQIKAKILKHNLMVFTTTSEAREIINFLPLHTPIYIDSKLSSDEKGEDFAEELYNHGFQNLYLATGYNPEHFKDLYFIKAIVSKNYPLSF